jgi:pyrimidine operon attenuation protein/uracil phosphoribosyltransferase
MKVTGQDAILLLDQAHINRTLERMTLELYEQHDPRKELGVIGIDERGFWLAEALADRWKQIADEPITVVRQWVKADRENTDGWRSLVKQCDHLVIVDDVMFSGRTMMQAVREILNEASPTSIQTMALVDRGHRAWPIMANVIGKRIPTKLNEHVEVRFNERGKCIEVELNWKEK